MVCRLPIANRARRPWTNGGDRRNHFPPLPARQAAPKTVTPIRKSLMARFVRQAYSLTAMWIRTYLSGSRPACRLP